MPTLQFLGTGNAFSSDGRLQQALWVQTDSRSAFLVDAGATVLTAMQRYGVRAADLEAVYLTHLHGDHIAGWPFLMLQYLFVTQLPKTLEVCGPTGTERCLNSLLDLCYGELREEHPDRLPLSFRELPVAPRRSIDGHGGVRFDVEPVDHHPTSIGYRFSLGDTVLGVSGDTRWCDGLEKLASGCDLLVMECTTLERSEAAHISVEELREGVERLDCERIVLVHTMDAIETALEHDPIARVTVAHDGDRLELG